MASEVGVAQTKWVLSSQENPTITDENHVGTSQKQVPVLKLGK